MNASDITERTEGSDADDLEVLRQAAAELTAADLMELKHLPMPPRAVEIVIKALMIILGEDDVTWAHCKKVIQKKDLLKRLMAIEPEDITAEQFKDLTPLVNLVSYKYILYANKSVAPLWAWILTMYYERKKVKA